MPTRVTIPTALVGAFLLMVSAALGAPQEGQHYRAGIGMLSKGLNDLAEKELRAYLLDYPSGTDANRARYSLGVCLVRLNRHAEAAKELDGVIGLKGFEFEAEAMLLRAQCAVTNGDDAKAVSVLGALLAGHQDWERLDQAAMMLGEAQYRRGQAKDAAETLEPFALRWSKSQWTDRAELFCAMSLSEQGDHVGAAQRANRLRERGPDGPYAASALQIEARSLVAHREFAAAAECYAQSARSSSGDARIEALIGEALAASQGHDWKRADRALNEAERSNGDPKAELIKRLILERGRIEFDRAAFIASQGDDAAALDAWTRWRERFASHELAADAVEAEAWCAYRVGRTQDSLELCKKLSAMKRADSEPVRLLIAENLYVSGDFDRAASAYAELLEAYPAGEHGWRAAVRRGLCYLKLERDGDADAALRPLMTGTGTGDPELRRDALATLGSHAMLREDWKRGEEWFAMLVEAAGPEDVGLDAALRLGICVLRQQDYARAIPIFEQVIKLDSDSPQALQARFERGQSLIEAGRLEEAQAALEDVIKRDSGDARFAPHARRHLASIASRRGRPEDAGKILASLAASDRSGAMQFELGMTWLAAERYAEAEAAFRAFLDSTPRAAECAEALVRLATAINRQGRAADALAVLDRTDHPRSATPELRAGAAYERGLALRTLNRESEAAEALRLAIAERGTRIEPYALLDLAQLECKDGNDRVALALLDRCDGASGGLAEQLRNPLLERAAYQRVICLSQLKDYAESATAAAEFIQAWPSSELQASARMVRGEALLAAGATRESAVEFEALAASNVPAAVRATALLRSGEAWAACQQWRKSEDASAAFLKAYPNSDQWFRAAFAQGWARENDGRHDAAMEVYRDVASRHEGPTAARAQFQIGECLFAQGKHEQAIAEFLKTDLLFAYPEWSAAAIYEAGRCLNEIGRLEDAEKQFNDLTTRFPDSQWSKLAKEAAPRQAGSAPAATTGSTKPAGRTPAGQMD